MKQLNTSSLVHLIIKTNDIRAALQEVNTKTAGIFGNVEAFDDGESIANCMPAVCTHPLENNGYQFVRVAIEPEFLSLWPIGKYGNFEIMPYPAYIDHVDPETGEVTQTPNREPYNCGSYTWTDEDGNEHTSDIMLGGWG